MTIFDLHKHLINIQFKSDEIYCKLKIKTAEKNSFEQYT